ncbi:MAG: hypothetical protein KKD33_01310, partial [Verrucomicrobia bacterium]|nr:hypothetical protein [Verrucomicrobiota bacterium]
GYALSRLVLPWPFFLSPRAVDKVRAFIDQGGVCLCYGYPLSACSRDDHGLEMLKSYLGSNFVKSAKQRFINYEKNAVRGMGLFKGKDLRVTLDEKENRTAVRVRERLKQDSIALPYVPLNVKPGHALLSYKGDTIGVKARHRDLYYFSFEFPMYGKAASAWLDHVTGTEWPEFADTCYVQQYERGNETLLAVCAKSRNGSIRGCYRIAGDSIKLPEGRMAVIRLKNNRPVEVKSW